MGYDCPVCATPQADARHLANHLAFTALVHGDDHEAWLDEHCPGWEEQGEADLAERAAPLAEQAEYPQVFEDTTGGDGDHDHEHDSPADRGRSPGRGSVPGTDAEVEAALEAARELTRERLEE
jgi:hypothetical protein